MCLQSESGHVALLSSCSRKMVQRNQLKYSVSGDWRRKPSRCSPATARRWRLLPNSSFFLRNSNEYRCVWQLILAQLWPRLPGFDMRKRAGPAILLPASFFRLNLLASAPID